MTGSISNPTAVTRQIILLLGMHRSGTSVLSRLINLMGAHIGNRDELLPPDPKVNPTGYWERLDLLREHEVFLQKNGYGWGKIANFHLDRIDPNEVQTLGDNLAEICDRIESGDHPLLIKDPRLCFLLPVWHRIVDKPLHVFAVRDPGKVAASLMNAFPGVFTTHYLLAFWQKHIQSALSALNGKRVLFVSYEHLLQAPGQASARLAQGLNELGASGLQPLQHAQLESLVDQKLDRSSSNGHARLSSTQLDLRKWLDRQCAADGPVTITDIPDVEAPDDVLRELEEVREECARHGVRMARNQEKSALAS